MKNGGDHFLVEIASREFMDNLVSILKIPALNLEVKNNILRLVQNWSVAVEGKPTLSYMGTVYKTLTNEGEPDFYFVVTQMTLYHQASNSRPRTSLSQTRPCLIRPPHPSGSTRRSVFVAERHSPSQIVSITAEIVVSSSTRLVPQNPCPYLILASRKTYGYVKAAIRS